LTPPNGTRGSEATIALMNTWPDWILDEELLLLGILSPGGSTEAERRIVRKLDGLPRILHSEQHCHRPEKLLAIHIGRARHISERRWFVD
jgi:hypothetical protein